MTFSTDQYEPPAPAPKRSSPNALQILAAVVIFMVLGAIIMPFPHGRASEAQQQAECASHLRVLGYAMMQYCQDYDEAFPSGRPDGAGRGWAGQIGPDERLMAIRGVKHEGQDDAVQAVWACPDDPTGPDRGIDPPGLAISYGMNATLTADRNLPNCSTKYSRLTALQSTVLLFEVRGPIVQVDLPNEGGVTKPKSGWFSAVGNGMANALQKGGMVANLDAFGPVQYGTGDIGARGCGLGACLPPRHGTFSEYLAADGHVAALSPFEVSSGNSPATSSGQTGDLASGTAASTDRLGKSNRIAQAPVVTMTFSAR